MLSRSEPPVPLFMRESRWEILGKKTTFGFQNTTMRKVVLVLLLFSSLARAQSDSTFVDNKYLEDQLYFNLTYITLLDLPEQIKLSGFSFGLAGGFIKDIPLNERRNIGLGAGIGYAFNNYYFNVRTGIEEDLEEIVLRNNKIMLHSLELPIELRFRTSTAEKYKFWRFYPGLKFSYVFADNTKFGKTPDFDVDDIVKVNDLQYGLTFSAGYNKWNLHMYYGLNELFNNNRNYPKTFEIRDFRIGLIFYIF